MLNFACIVGFQWDDGNGRKNGEKHGVEQAEAEQIFLNEPLLILSDQNHSLLEPRWNALGKTDQGRMLHITLTLRSNDTLIRIISARDMNKKERNQYDR
jgi:uncharacterized protein